MLVTLIHHPETLELKYFPCDEGEVLELDEELVNKVKECSTDRVQEVLKSMKKSNPISVHHRLPESWGGNLQPNNALHLRENVHRALHTVFQDATPIQRLRMSLEADKQVLHPDVYLEISRVLQRFEKIEINVYDPRCFNSDKFMKKCHSNA